MTEENAKPLSRLGKMPVSIPGGVEVSVETDKIKVKGPKGSLQQPFPPTISAKVSDGNILVETDGNHPNSKAFHGLGRALIQNMVIGVSEGWTKELLLEGVGYRAKVEGNNLVLSLGFSHPVEMPIPEGLSVNVTGKKNEEVTITGADRDQLGEWAAKVREKRPPEPYKGKGVRYKDERVKLKAGKRVGA